MSDDDEVWIRILVCNVCRSIQEIPDYDGPPKMDVLLEYRVAEHRFDSGNPHRGFLARVKASDWAKKTYRDAINDKFAVEQGFTTPGDGVGLGQTFYDLKGNFQTDAMVCWKQHNRTTDCGDYRAKSKELLADTKADRKAEGLSTAPRDRPKHWLCDYCPVHSVVTQKRRKAAGLYDK